MSTSDKNKEAQRLWRLAHPNYYREWQAKMKAWRDEEKARGNTVHGNSRPRISQSKLAYSVTITNLLREEERIVSQKAKR